jgi:TP901 family phage tail tape measure protein
MPGIRKLGLGVTLSVSGNMTDRINAAARAHKKLEAEAKQSGKTVREQVDKMTASLSRYARGFTVGIKMMALGTGMLAPLVGLGMVASKSAHAMSEINSLLVDTGLTAAQQADKIHQYERAIASIGPTTRITIRELETEGYTLVSALGIDKAIAALSYVNKLAVAGKGTLRDAASLFSTTMLTFGHKMDAEMSLAEKSERIANIYAGAIKLFKTDLPTLAAGMQYATAISSSMGQTLEETAAAVAMLQSAGMPSTMAGTSYSAFMRGVSQLTRRMKSETMGTLSIYDFIDLSEGKVLSTGKGPLANNPLTKIKWKDEMGYILPLYDILEQLEEVFNIKTPQDALMLKENAHDSSPAR